MKKIIRKVAHFLGLEIVNYASHVQNIESQEKQNNERTALLSAINRLDYIVSKIELEKLDSPNEFEFLKFSVNKLIDSKSQLFQDLFVLYWLKEKRSGFFIEFGATDGIGLSNSYLLEKSYDWKGILCEPGKFWQNKLSENRNAVLDYRCVWSKSGEEFTFNETIIPELSSLEIFNDSDFHAERRLGGKTYTVETISLNDLLIYHNAPQQIDYLSIDTEGSEYDILSAFDFKKFTIRIITVEHNFSDKRKDIYDLLVAKGYKRVFEKISLFDDWYVLDFERL